MNQKTTLGDDRLVRNMQMSDLTTVLEIQAESYPASMNEPLAAFESKLTCSPSSCFVAMWNHKVCAYLIAVPSRLGMPPALGCSQVRMFKSDITNHDTLGMLDCLHLHDMAVRKSARGLGLGKLLVDAYFGAFHQQDFRHRSLIAVQKSFTYWEQFGFRKGNLTHDLQSRLRSYGEDAVYMLA